MEPVYFAGAAKFRAWLRKHHATATEILVGYHKVATGRSSMTWAESVDEALCVGWIDGIRRRVDDERYTIRFIARKPDLIGGSRSAFGLRWPPEPPEQQLERGEREASPNPSGRRRAGDRLCILGEHEGA